MIIPVYYLELIKNLIKFKGISPGDGGAIDFLKEYLEKLGFICEIIQCDNIKNLYAKLSPNKKVDICFAGHVDVVPPGNLDHWTIDPFTAEIIDNKIYGRGIVDMKSAICCFIVAVTEFLQENSDNDLNIGIILTSDEETDSKGMPAVVKYLQENNEQILNCIVGEPTCEEKLGDIIKIGRRGSMNFTLKIQGKQGHVAYPHLAKNPINCAVDILKKLINHKFDDGNEHFQPSHCEITNITTNNSSTNVIPGEIVINFNIRFNNLHTPESLLKTVEEICINQNYKIDIQYNKNPALPFLNQNDKLVEICLSSIRKITKIAPKVSTNGGTSDARFLKDITNVVEFGLLNKTAHQINEHSNLEDILLLKDVYKRIMLSILKPQEF